MKKTWTGAYPAVIWIPDGDSFPVTPGETLDTTADHPLLVKADPKPAKTDK